LVSTDNANAASLDGAHLTLGWAFPFLGLLASIGLGPLIAEKLWDRHYGKIAFLWAAGLALALVASFGAGAAFEAVIKALLVDYLPFILMFALYVAAGGVVLRAAAHGRPVINTLLLAIGTIIASFIGVTAASMIMIRPLLHSNYERARKAHIVIFFIFLVSNIGGALTPLGNPPLFFGFVNGVEFFWPTIHQWPQTLFATAVLLLLFFALDTWLLAREPARRRKRGRTTFRRDLSARGIFYCSPWPSLRSSPAASGIRASPSASSASRSPCKIRCATSPWSRSASPRCISPIAPHVPPMASNGRRSSKSLRFSPRFSSAWSRSLRSLKLAATALSPGS
jgi:putative citrate transport